MFSSSFYSHVKVLTLLRAKKPEGFFISAGCPLTKNIKDEIDKETSVVDGIPRSFADAYANLR